MIPAATEAATRVEQHAADLIAHLELGDDHAAQQSCIALRACVDVIARELNSPLALARQRLGEIRENSKVQKTANTWQVTLRTPADDSADDAARRVRMALKCLLRSYGLTCTAVVKSVPKISADLKSPLQKSANPVSEVTA